jgi:hypothetical protein
MNKPSPEHVTKLLTVKEQNDIYINDDCIAGMRRPLVHRRT